MKWLFLLLLASACTPDFPPKGAVNIEGTQAIMVAREAWVSVGLPDTTDCPAPWWLHVSPQELEEKCGAGVPSCTQTSGPCVLACVDIATNVAYWDHTQPNLEAYAQAHESYHSFGECVLGDSDGGHRNPKVWNEALGIVFTRLYLSEPALHLDGLPRVD